MPFSRPWFCTRLFCVHSFRSGGATADANAAFNDGLFKRHGRCRSDRTKYDYLKDNSTDWPSICYTLQLKFSFFFCAKAQRQHVHLTKSLEHDIERPVINMHKIYIMANACSPSSSE